MKNKRLNGKNAGPSTSARILEVERSWEELATSHKHESEAVPEWLEYIVARIMTLKNTRNYPEEVSRSEFVSRAATLGASDAEICDALKWAAMKNVNGQYAYEIDGRSSEQNEIALIPSVE